MKLFLIFQKVNRGYDTYDSAVVCAKSMEEAQRMSPNDYVVWDDEVDSWRVKRTDGTVGPTTQPYDWAPHVRDVQAEYLGEASDATAFSGKRVIVASFNAG